MFIKVLSSSLQTTSAGTTAQITADLDGEVVVFSSVCTDTKAKTVSSEKITGILRTQLMGAIEQRLFNDYNRRSF